jgi:hypothetical protein
MTIYFVDSSALAKRYLNEIGSQWVKNWFLQSPSIAVVISELTILELSMTFACRQFEGSITLTEFQQLEKLLTSQVRNDYEVVRLQSRIINDARSLVGKHHPFRTLDAIQLGSAITAQKAIPKPITFISADQKLLAKAASEGFTIDDPNSHP